PATPDLELPPTPPLASSFSVSRDLAEPCVALISVALAPFPALPLPSALPPSPPQICVVAATIVSAAGLLEPVMLIEPAAVPPSLPLLIPEPSPPVPPAAKATAFVVGADAVDVFVVVRSEEAFPGVPTKPPLEPP